MNFDQAIGCYHLASQLVAATTLDTVFEWLGTVFGLAGAFLLATNSRYSRQGWFWFLTANIVMIAFAISIRRYGLLVGQIGFTCITLFGIYRSSKTSLPDINRRLFRLR